MPKFTKIFGKTGFNIWQYKRFLLSTILSIFLILSTHETIINVNLKYQTALAQKKVVTNALKTQKTIGAWVPSQYKLEKMISESRTNAIRSLIAQGFNEYYFVMRNFTDVNEVKATEELLNSTDKTDLKVIVILLPPSEGGVKSVYDWKGWINYFNSVKRHHNSFQGFAIDDFNAMQRVRRIFVRYNVNYMIASKLAEALEYKNKELQFYPVMYVDDLAGIETTKKEFGKYISGLILASIFYHYISDLEQRLIAFSKLYTQPLKYVVYPVKATAKSPLPSDQLIMATISTATRLTQGIIIYVKTDRQVVQDYLHNRDNPLYLSKIALMEHIQAKDEMLKYRRHIVVCTVCLYK